MKTSRHIHYVDQMDSGLRYEFVYDPPRSSKYHLSEIEDWFESAKLPIDDEGSNVRQIQSPVSKGGLLRLVEVMKPGELLSFQLRSGHRLQNIVLDDADRVQIFNWKVQIQDGASGKNGDSFGLTYLVTIGRVGAFEMTAEVVKDDDHFSDKLRNDPSDAPMRAYLVHRSIAAIEDLAAQVESFPEIMSHEQAARYIGVAKGTLYNLRDVPRLKHNRYSKQALDEYLVLKPRAKRRRGV